MYPQGEPLSSGYSSARQCSGVCSCLHSSSSISISLLEHHPLPQTSSLQQKSIGARLSPSWDLGTVGLSQNIKVGKELWDHQVQQSWLSAFYSHLCPLISPTINTQTHPGQQKWRRKWWEHGPAMSLWSLDVCCPLSVLSFEGRGRSLSEQGSVEPPPRSGVCAHFNRES